MMQDNRALPVQKHTYYVVDHLPTMKNLWRYDTVEEAIEKYKSLPDTMWSAIGGSIDNRHELDLIQRRDSRPVLVMDFERVTNPVWRESAEIQNAIDKMIAELNVQHQLSWMFGNQYVSSIVDLERYSERALEHYFHNKLLRPKDPQYLLTAIDEVHVEGYGWLKLNTYLKHLQNSRPKTIGVGAKNNFVTRVNIDYIDDSGRIGQADLSTMNYVLLEEKTAKEVSPEKLSEDLYRFVQEVDPYEARDQADSREASLETMRKDIADRNLHTYIKHISELLEEGLPSEADHKKALSLLARLTVLTPKEFRKPALTTMIQKAGYEARQQSSKPPKTIEANKDR